MSDSSMAADIIFILAIAAFIIYKYRSVLGEKTGHDVSQPRAERTVDPSEKVVDLHPERQGEPEEVVVKPAKDEQLESLEEGTQKTTIEQMKQLDETFTLDSFIKGAKAAFEMVIEAYNQADRATLKMLLEGELYRDFDQELKKEEAQASRGRTTLVSILSARPVGAELKRSQAVITVRFVSEQIYVEPKTGDEEGGASPIEKVEDEWVFERDLSSRNPNWTITDM